MGTGKILLLLSLAAALENGAWAGSVPEAISYQGRLDESGFPISGIKQMTFRVYDALSGGSALWDGGARPVTLSQGLFNVFVAVPHSALGGGGGRYLEVQVGSTVLSPRATLKSIPYALVAKSVEGSLEISGAGLSVSAESLGGAILFVSSQTGKVGIGISNPGYQLDVQGDLRSTGTLVGYSLAVQSAVLSGDFSVGSSTLAVVSGFAGIGTTAPSAKLSVGGSISQTGVLASSGAGNNYFAGSIGLSTASPASKLTVLDGDVRITTSIPQTRGIYFPDGSFMSAAGVGSADAAANAGDLVVQSDLDNDGEGDVVFRARGSEVLRVSRAGNIGVGTSAPGALLDVYGAAQWGSGASKSTFTAAGNLQLVSGATIASNGTLSFSTAASASLTGVPALFISAQTGFVGISTASPSARLHSAGDIRSDGVYRVAGPIAIAQGKSSSLIEIGSQDPVALRFVSNSAVARLTISTAGSVGIASAAPAALFTVGDGTAAVTVGGKVGIGTAYPATGLQLSSGSFLLDGSGAGIFVGNSDFLVRDGRVGVGASNPAGLFQVGAQTLAAASSGKVGIGTTSPAVTLDVTGDVQTGSGTAKILFTSGGNLQVAGNLQAAALNGSAVFLADPLGAAFEVNGSTTLATSGRAGVSLSTHVWINFGSVGFGTSNPASKLHVSSGVLIINGTGPGLSIGVSSFTVSGGGAGIGTAAPAAKLQVSSAAILLDGAGADLRVGAGLFTVSGANAGIGTSHPVEKLHVSSGLVILDGLNAGFVLAGASTFTAAGGRVGVGTTAPAAFLDVEGSAQFGSGAFKSTFTSSGNLQFVNGATVASNGTLSFSTAASASLTGTPALFIDGQGRTGLATPAPAARLHLSGSDTRLRISNTTSGTGKSWDLASGNDGSFNLEIAGAVTPLTVLPASGKVGIGTASPSSALHVVGKIAVSEGILFADGTYQTTKETASSLWTPVGNKLYNALSGKVGMGALSPATKMEVYSDQNSAFGGGTWGASLTPAQALTVSNGFAGGYDPVLLYRMATSAGSLKTAGAVGLLGRAAWTQGDAAAQLADMYFVLRDTADALESRLTISSAAVGIGTSAADSALHISSFAPNANAQVHLLNSSVGAGTTTLKIGQGSPEAQWGEVISRSDNIFAIRNVTGSGASRGGLLLNWDGGNVGIGTHTPVNLLDVKGSAALGSYAGSNAAPASGLIVSGSVGIGTSNPGQTLSVAGVIESTASAGGFKFPDGTVQSTPSYSGNMVFISLASDESTASGVYGAVDVAFSTSITTSGGAVLVTLTGSLSNDTDTGGAEFRVNRDAGAEYQPGGRLLDVSSTTYLSMGFKHLFTGLSAGVHTFLVEWRRVAAGTVSCSPAASPDRYSMRLMAQEL